MADTEITLLGAPRILHAGVPVEVDTRKAIALVAYLAVTGRRHTRDALSGLLWPEYGQTRARAALRRTLSSLKAARAEGWLVADREGVELDRGSVLVDVDRFHGLLAACRAHGHAASEVCPECLPPLEKAVGLYRDDFMSGFGLRDSAAFDDWQFFQGESLRRELADALERLAGGRAAGGEWEPAIAHARRWLALDSLHEPAHRLLMALYAWSGQRAAALRQYRECTKVLGRELGVAPLEETTGLYRAIQENDLPSPPVLARPGASALPGQAPPGAEEAGPAPVREDPFVGRQDEWEALLRAYGEVEKGGRLVVLEGEAGIGKTRLAGEFVAHAARRGATVVVARCYAGETNLAYGPFIEGLGAALGTRSMGPLEELPAGTLGEACRLLPELGALLPEAAAPPPLDTPGALARFYEGVVRVLLALLDGPAPGVLLLDDLQWADGASLDLLAYLVHRLRDRPLLVLVTWRPEEVSEGHRLRGLLAEARRSGRAAVLKLGRLDPEAVRELVGRTLGEEDSGALAPRLGGETEGLPLFLTEYLAAVTNGELDPRSEAWALPGGVHDLLRGRLAAVGETAGQVLAAAAVVGRSFDFDTVREASGRGEEETLLALEELVGRRLILESHDPQPGGPTYDFDHDKLRTLVYEETGLARRRLLHRRAAAALAGRARGREAGTLAGQIARHLRLAGQDAEAAEHYRLAGDHARDLYANGDALAHYEEALALGHSEAAALHEAIGDLRTRRGEYAAALAGYELAAASGGTVARLEHKIGNVHARRGDRDLARFHYESAAEALEGQGDAFSGELARLYADRSLLSHLQNDPVGAERFAREALGLAEEAGDARARAQAHNMLGILAGDADDGEAVLRHLRESLRLAEELGDPEAKVAALNNLALALGSRGATGEAVDVAQEALDLCARLGDRHREAALHNNLADLLHASGREEESMAHLKKAVAIFAEVGEEGGMRPEIWKLVEW
jgi:DNA-binding SARP family transcriptional activator